VIQTLQSTASCTEMLPCYRGVGAGGVGPVRCGAVCPRASCGTHMYQCVAVCCSVLQCVAVCCSVLQCVAVQCAREQVVVRICINVLQCVAVRCSVLQCVAVCCSAVCPK